MEKYFTTLIHLKDDFEQISKYTCRFLSVIKIRFEVKTDLDSKYQGLR